jgi:hypothetical protein
MTNIQTNARRSQASGRAVAPAVVLVRWIVESDAGDRGRELRRCAVRTMSRRRDASNDDKNSPRVHERRSATVPNNLYEHRLVDSSRTGIVPMASLDATT